MSKDSLKIELPENGDLFKVCQGLTNSTLLLSMYDFHENATRMRDAVHAIEVVKKAILDKIGRGNKPKTIYLKDWDSDESKGWLFQWFLDAIHLISSVSENHNLEETKMAIESVTIILSGLRPYEKEQLRTETYHIKKEDIPH